MHELNPNIYTYWDNLQNLSALRWITHIHGHLLQEEGYYPFGLEMKAISSAAAMKMQTRYKFNAGTELEASFDVDYYETFFREYDAQIGRFTGVDAMSEKKRRLSPYEYGNNDPNYYVDPSGALEGEALRIWNQIVHYVQSGYSINEIEVNGQSVDFFYFGDGQGNGGSAFIAGNFGGDDFGSVYGGIRDFSGQAPPVTSGLVQKLLESSWGQEVWYANVHQDVQGGVDGFSVDLKLPNDVNQYNGLYFLGTNTVTNMLNAVYELYKSSSNKATWFDYTTTSLGIVGGIVETGVGVLTSDLGLGVAIGVDGFTRTGGNIAKFVTLVNSGKSQANTVPTNLMGTIGRVVDGNMGNQTQVGSAQTWLGITNDAASLIVPTSDLTDSWRTINNLTNGYTSPNSIFNTYIPDGKEIINRFQ